MAERNDDKLGSLREQLSEGLKLDPYELQSILYKDANNVIFTLRGVKKSTGYSILFTTTDGFAIRGIAQLVEAGVQYIYFGDKGKLYKSVAAAAPTVVGSGFTGIDTATATQEVTLWSIVPFGSWVLATNGVDPPQIFKGTSFTAISGTLSFVDVLVPGTGYSVSDTVTISGGGGTGATAEVSSVDGAGGIEAVTITAAGTGFTSTPTATAANGTGASLSAEIQALTYSTVDVLINRGPHMLGFRLGGAPKDYAWCSEDNLESWVAYPNNSAGSNTIRELDSAIIAAVPLGDKIAVYGKDQMFLISYLGAPLYFGHKPALNGVGAVGKHAVVSRGRFNYGLSRQGFWETDGVSYKYIDDPDIRRWVQDNINWVQSSKTNCYHDEDNTSIVWHVPTGAEPDVHLTYNYVTKRWSKGDFAFTSSIERNVFTNPLVANSIGKMYYAGYGDDKDTVAMLANIRTTAIDLGEPDFIKEVDKIRIGYIGTGLRYRIGTSDTPDGSITWGSYSEVSPGFEFDPVHIAGRYFFLDLDSQDLGDKWELQAIDFYGKVTSEQ